MSCKRVGCKSIQGCCVKRKDRNCRSYNGIFGDCYDENVGDVELQHLHQQESLGLRQGRRAGPEYK